ncbi:RibD family protein [Methyloversatilis thermotolerans]|uniref:RibD family protein n=1 Tax=Methyloversatilis thermotolerans TaxID=1346290 RepID=UPI000380C583|nr:RibD family protein [Methyloversatilis thermotolerans]
MTRSPDDMRRTWSRILQLKTGDWSADDATWFHGSAPEDAVTRDALPDAGAPAALRALFGPLLAGSRCCIAQLGQSLDGRIATASGHSHYINGVAARTHLHRLRAAVDAVIVGVGTANADAPRLTVRLVDGTHPQRVIIDPDGRARGDLPAFVDTDAPTLHLVAADAEVARHGGAHVTQLRLARTGTGFAPQAILDALAARGLRRVLVEGGAVTVSRFIEAGVVDRLHLLVSPMLIGSGRPGLQLPDIATLEQARRPRATLYRCGSDTLFDLDLRADARASTSAPGRLDSSTHTP